MKFISFQESIDVFHKALRNIPRDYPAHSIYNMLGMIHVFSFTGSTFKLICTHLTASVLLSMLTALSLNYLSYFYTKSCDSCFAVTGQAYSFVEDKVSAEEWYRKALQANESHVPAHLAYAKHLAQVVGIYSPAIGLPCLLAASSITH